MDTAQPLPWMTWRARLLVTAHSGLEAVAAHIESFLPAARHASSFTVADVAGVLARMFTPLVFHVGSTTVHVDPKPSEINVHGCTDSGFTVSSVVLGLHQPRRIHSNKGVCWCERTPSRFDGVAAEWSADPALASDVAFRTKVLTSILNEVCALGMESGVLVRPCIIYWRASAFRVQVGGRSPHPEWCHVEDFVAGATRSTFRSLSRHELTSDECTTDGAFLASMGHFFAAPPVPARPEIWLQHIHVEAAAWTNVSLPTITLTRTADAGWVLLTESSRLGGALREAGHGIGLFNFSGHLYFRNVANPLDAMAVYVQTLRQILDEQGTRHAPRTRDDAVVDIFEGVCRCKVASYPQLVSNCTMRTSNTEDDLPQPGPLWDSPFMFRYATEFFPWLSSVEVEAQIDAVGQELFGESPRIRSVDPATWTRRLDFRPQASRFVTDPIGDVTSQPSCSSVRAPSPVSTAESPEATTTASADDASHAAQMKKTRL